jgi:hypothetical protein
MCSCVGEKSSMKENLIYEIACRISQTYSHNIRTGGKIEFIRDQGPLRRDIRAPGFEWSQDSMRNLAKVLWASQRAHSYAMAAYRVFSKMNSSSFSPDGLLGGRGYIQAVKDMRTGLSQVAEVLSSFSDTVQDELNANHWKEIPKNQVTGDLIQDAEQVKANPEQVVEQAYADVAPEDTSEYDVPVENPDPDDFNPNFKGSGSEYEESEEDEDNSSQTQTASTELTNTLQNPIQDRPDYGAKRKVKKDEPGSMLPTDASEQPLGKTESEIVMHTVSPDHGSYATAFHRAIQRLTGKNNDIRTSSHGCYRIVCDGCSSIVAQCHCHNAMENDIIVPSCPNCDFRLSSSSIPTETLPGPRIDHIGPGEGDPNDGNEWSSDDLVGLGLSSGVNESDSLLESEVQDGVSPYMDPTDGDNSVLNIGTRVARQNYSWLPGSRNEKNLNYYDRGLTNEDIEWMRDHSDPDPPEGPLDSDRYNTSFLWGVNF